MLALDRLSKTDAPQCEPGAPRTSTSTSSYKKPRLACMHGLTSSIYVYVRVRVRLCMFICVCARVCIYVCMCVCMCQHPLDDDNYDKYAEDDDVPKFKGNQSAFKDF